MVQTLKNLVDPEHLKTTKAFILSKSYSLVKCSACNSCAVVDT